MTDQEHLSTLKRLYAELSAAINDAKSVGLDVYLRIETTRPYCNSEGNQPPTISRTYR